MRIIQLSVKLSEYIPHDAQLLSHVNLIATLWTVAHQGSSVHGISQARILEQVAISFSRGSSQPRDGTHVLLRLLHWQVDSLPLSHLGNVGS